MRVDEFFGSRTLVNEYTTSWTVTGDPSWNFAPERNGTTYVVSSICFGISEARAIYGSRVAGWRSTSPSKTCRLTAIAVALVVIMGSNPPESV